MAEIVDFGLQQHKIKMDSRYFENVLSVVAGDTGRRIEVQLLDTNGMVQDTTGLNLRLNAEIAGKATYTDATLADATTGKYQLDLSNGMFLATGNWQFQWQITDSAGKKLHSFAFTGNVGINISEGGSQATNFYLNLEDLKAMQDDLVNGTIDSSILETNITEKLTDLETQYAPKLTEVTAQLAQTASRIDVVNTSKVGGNIKAEPENLSAKVLGMISGDGTPINLLSVPQDKSVTRVKLTNAYNSKTRLYTSGDLSTLIEEGIWFKPGGNNPIGTPIDLIGDNTTVNVSVFEDSSLGTFIVQNLISIERPNIQFTRAFKLGGTIPVFKNITSQDVQRIFPSAEKYISNEPTIDLMNQIQAIRDVSIIGADPNIPLKFWMVCRNFTTWNYRIMIAKKQGGVWSTFIDSGINFKVTENPVGYTNVEFKSGNVTFKARINYNLLPNAGRMIQGSTVDIEPFYIIPPSSVKLTESSNGGGEAYDQSLNTTDNVEFASLQTGILEVKGDIQTGTLISPPVGLLSGDMWADTTDSNTHPIIRVMI